MAEQTSSGAGAEPLAFRMPSLGADMTVGTVLDWHIGVGDVVRHGDIVALVDTEKAEIEVECWDDGTVAELVVPVGEQVPVGTVLAWLSPAGVPTGAVATPQAAPTPPAAPPRRPRSRHRSRPPRRPRSRSPRRPGLRRHGRCRSDGSSPGSSRRSCATWPRSGTSIPPACRAAGRATRCAGSTSNRRPYRVVWSIAHG
ncbi:MAG: biotin/lipoyl-containing protein [Acidimicrobiales bacterium]